MGPGMDGLTGNTLDSHRLAAWAGRTYGLAKQNALMEEMMNSYFSMDEYIGGPPRNQQTSVRPT